MSGQEPAQGNAIQKAENENIVPAAISQDLCVFAGHTEKYLVGLCQEHGLTLASLKYLVDIKNDYSTNFPKIKELLERGYSPRQIHTAMELREELSTVLYRDRRDSIKTKSDREEEAQEIMQKRGWDTAKLSLDAILTFNEIFGLADLSDFEQDPARIYSQLIDAVQQLPPDKRSGFLDRDLYLINRTAREICARDIEDVITSIRNRSRDPKYHAHEESGDVEELAGKVGEQDGYFEGMPP